MNISPDTRRDFECIASSCPRQWLYLLGDEGAVYSEARNRFAGLDAAGVSAYLAFDAGAQIEDLSRVRDAHERCPQEARDRLAALCIPPHPEEVLTDA